MHSWLREHQIQLSQQISAERLPHALLIKGIKGAGKKHLSQWLIDVLLCQKRERDASQQIFEPCGTCKSCLLMKSKSFPDYVLVEAEKNTLGVDAIRAATKSFEKTPQIGNVKTVQILDAQLMTLAAANALLKTLEEPTKQSFIVLVSSDSDIMLPTIISRCSIIDVRPPTGEALLGQVSSQKPLDAFANLSHLPELKDPELAKAYDDLLASFLLFLREPAQYLQLQTLLLEQEDAMRWLEKMVVGLYRHSFQWKSTASESATIEVNADILWKIYQCTVTSNKQLLTIAQVNKQFMIEKLLADVTQLMHEIESQRH